MLYAVSLTLAGDRWVARPLLGRAGSLEYATRGYGRTRESATAACKAELRERATREVSSGR
jgi:hypothetical protein